MSGHDDWTTALSDQPVLAGVATIATWLTLPVLLLAGDGSALSTAIAVLVAGLLVGARRDSRTALFGLLLIGLLWLTSNPDARAPWSLVLASLMLIAHAAAALRSTLPPGARLDASIVWRWVFRVAATLALTALTYLLVVAADYVEPTGSELMISLALVVLAALVLLLRRETVGNSQS
jgi:hypothetical protein